MKYLTIMFYDFNRSRSRSHSLFLETRRQSLLAQQKSRRDELFKNLANVKEAKNYSEYLNHLTEVDDEEDDQTKRTENDLEKVKVIYKSMSNSDYQIVTKPFSPRKSVSLNLNLRSGQQLIPPTNQENTEYLRYSIKNSKNILRFLVSNLKNIFIYIVQYFNLIDIF